MIFFGECLCQTFWKEGLLVPAGDIHACQQAILMISNDHDFRKKCEINAKIKAQELTYQNFSNQLIALCKEVLNENSSIK